jgi:hypothetical protein
MFSCAPKKGEESKCTVANCVPTGRTLDELKDSIQAKKDRLANLQREMSQMDVKSDGGYGYKPVCAT